MFGCSVSVYSKCALSAVSGFIILLFSFYEEEREDSNKLKSVNIPYLNFNRIIKTLMKTIYIFVNPKLQLK